MRTRDATPTDIDELVVQAKYEAKVLGVIPLLLRHVAVSDERLRPVAARMFDEGCDILRIENRLIALDIDVSLGGNSTGDLGNPVAPCWVVIARQFGPDSVVIAHARNLFAVGGHNHVVAIHRLEALVGGAHNHGFASNINQWLSRKPG